MIDTIIKDKKVLFITTKNKDYIRNTQEIRLIAEFADKYDVIAYGDKSYIKRLFMVWIATLKHLLALKKYDYIFVGFAPQLMFMFFPFFRKEKLIIDFFISMYDTLVDDRKKVAKNSFTAKLLHKIDAYVLKKAMHIIVDTNADREYFSEEFKVSPKKMEVLYLKPDTSIYDPALYPKKESQKPFTVLYFGSILPLQGVDIILKAVRSMVSLQDIRFVIIGPINKNMDQSRFCNVVFYQWLPQEKLALEIAKADLCLAGHFDGNIGKAKRTIAGKTYIYKAMGKPVILGDNPANHELFEEDGMQNFYVKMGDPSALKDKILEVKDIIEHEKSKCNHPSI